MDQVFLDQRRLPIIVVVDGIQIETAVRADGLELEAGRQLVLDLQRGQALVQVLRGLDLGIGQAFAEGSGLVHRNVAAGVAAVPQACEAELHIELLRRGPAQLGPERVNVDAVDVVTQRRVEGDAALAVMDVGQAGE